MAISGTENYWRYRFHICLAYFSGLNFRGYSPNSYGTWNMVRLRTSIDSDPGDLPLIYELRQGSWLNALPRIHGAGMLTWLGYIDGIHGAPYMAAPWIRHGLCPVAMPSCYAQLLLWSFPPWNPKKPREDMPFLIIIKPAIPSDYD